MLHLSCKKLNKRCGAYLSKYGMHSQLVMVISVSHYPFVSVNYPCSYECSFEAVAKEIQAWPLQCQNRIQIFLLHGCFGNVEKSLTTILNCTTLANKSYIWSIMLWFLKAWTYIPFQIQTEKWAARSQRFLQRGST